MVGYHLRVNEKVTKEDLTYNAPIGIIIYDDSLRITKINRIINKIFKGENLEGKLISEIETELLKVVQRDRDVQWETLKINEDYYPVLHSAESNSIYISVASKDKISSAISNKDYLMVVGTLFLPDYDDILYVLDDAESASFESKLIKELNKWAERYDVFLKQTDEDQYMILMNQSSLKKLEEEAFDSIEQIRIKYSQNSIPLSISVGISYWNQTFSQRINVMELMNQVKANLDLALGRGGDQIVVRAIGQDARFYGGNTNPTEKRSDIRVKMFFQALISAIKTSDSVLIAGHTYPDMDSIGSALAMHQIVSEYDKKVKILINKEELNYDIKQLLEEEYFQTTFTNFFIQHTEVNEFINVNSLVILVDHHRPSISEAEEYLDKCDLVIIDHHRQAEDYPLRTVLSYVEPSASSTAELITEYYKFYSKEEYQLNSNVATVLLAGIIIDTNQFSLRTGTRTFEAASYLKQQGADSITIQYLLKENLTTVMTRHHLLKQMTLMQPGYSVVVAENDVKYDNIVAAQTADDMLGISDIEASFVIYRRTSNKVGISARSLGRINVQTLMEKLGGGGHLSNAACQLENISTEEAYKKLKEIIKK